MTNTNDTHGTGVPGILALTPEGAGETDGLVRVIDETRDFVGGRPAPDLSAAVMRQVAQIGPPENGVLARLTTLLWTARPISFQFRPVYGVGAAVVVMAALAAVSGGEPTGGVPALAEAPAAAEPRLLVQFQFRAPAASTVQLVGSFTGWEPRYQLVQTAPGNWSVTLPLPPGVHDYAFLVDGQTWVPDPFAPAVRDGFGGANSRLSLLPPGDGSL